MFKSSKSFRKHFKKVSDARSDRESPELVDLTNIDDGPLVESCEKNEIDGNNDTVRNTGLSLPGQSNFAQERVMAVRRKKEKDRCHLSPFKSKGGLSPWKKNSNSLPRENVLLGSLSGSSVSEMTSVSSSYASSSHDNGKHCGFVRSSSLLSPTKLAIYSKPSSGQCDFLGRKVKRSDSPPCRKKRARVRLDQEGWPSSSDSSDCEFVKSSKSKTQTTFCCNKTKSEMEKKSSRVTSKPMMSSSVNIPSMSCTKPNSWMLCDNSSYTTTSVAAGTTEKGYRTQTHCEIPLPDARGKQNKTKYLSSNKKYVEKGLEHSPLLHIRSPVPETVDIRSESPMDFTTYETPNPTSDLVTIPSFHDNQTRDSINAECNYMNAVPHWQQTTAASEPSSSFVSFPVTAGSLAQNASHTRLSSAVGRRTDKKSGITKYGFSLGIVLRKVSKDKLLCCKKQMIHQILIT